MSAKKVLGFLMFAALILWQTAGNLHFETYLQDAALCVLDNTRSECVFHLLNKC